MIQRSNRLWPRLRKEWMTNARS
ncbi:uncharacterized protein DMAD_06603 [Drosophila madeirensis]|uniref:Uncharacterized protein n=1 Tax=Drosophila madeirensis TaxID=30013 RepID=A0AAU9FR21_DROMD